MTDQKGHEPLKKWNQNNNPKEAQKLKKEGPPLCRKIREKKERKKEEGKKKKKERKGGKEARKKDAEKRK